MTTINGDVIRIISYSLTEYDPMPRKPPEPVFALVLQSQLLEGDDDAWVQIHLLGHHRLSEATKEMFDCTANPVAWLKEGVDEWEVLYPYDLSDTVVLDLMRVRLGGVK